MALASPQWFNPWFNPPKRPAALTQTAMSHGKTHPYQTIWYHALLSPSVIDYIHHIISYHIISYHIISYHLPIFSGSPPIFLAFPQTNPPAQLRFSTSHLAPPQLILSEWLPRFAPRQPGRFPSQFSDITWMEPIKKKRRRYHWISLHYWNLLNISYHEK